MFLRVKVEKKIRHYTLSSREWINVLYVTPSSEDSPFGLLDRQSRLSLGSTDTGGNVDQKASAAEGSPDTLHACSWRLDGSRCICPLGWDSNRGMLGIRSGDCTNIPKSRGNQIASHWTLWALSSNRGNRVGGGYTYAHSAFLLIDRASTAMADGSGTGDTNRGSL